jgi:hypothetical protein
VDLLLVLWTQGKEVLDVLQQGFLKFQWHSVANDLEEAIV